MDRFVLAVDIGTSSLKAALITVEGKLTAYARVRFPAGRRTAWHWLHSFAEAWETLGKSASSVCAIAVSGNGPTLVSVDASGDPTALYLWNEPLSESESAAAAAATGVRKTASSPSIFLPRLRSFAALFPAELDSARFLLSGPEFLIYALTGSAVTVLPDPRYESAYWKSEDIAASGIDSALLPPFTAQGTIAGTTRTANRSIASRVPLLASVPPGIPVVAGGPDFTVALAGTGTIRPGTACDRAGTSEGLNACTAERISAPGLRTLPAVVPGLWNLSALLPDTGHMFHAWRRESGQANKSYPELMAEIQASPFSDSFLPCEIHHGRALVEDIGFSVRRAMDRLESAAGFVPVYALSGGQARNGIWNQMKADITGRTVFVTATPDGELMGDAVLGFAALGDYGSLEEAAGRMVRTDAVYEPDPETTKRYAEKYKAYEDIRNSGKP